MRLIVFLYIILATQAFGQREFGLAQVKKLCSPEFGGRGYVDNGHALAADYIKSQFESFGVKSFDSSYFQHFNIDVNSFPSDLSVAVGGTNLVPGEDFVVAPNSGSTKGTFKMQKVNRGNVANFLKTLKATAAVDIKDAIVLDVRGIENKDTVALFSELKVVLASITPVVWIRDGKFTWSVGHEEWKNAVVEIKREKFDSRATEITLNIKNEFKKGLETQNVIGFIPGKKKCKSIIVSAHYDHLGKMGQEAYFPGANDNASGVAMLLYLAKHFSTHQPEFNLVFMAFGAEEAGILGSKYYVEHPLFPLKKIRFVVNCDIMGTGDEGITVVNGTLHEKEFKKLTHINAEKEYLKKIKIRGRAANSDHYWFSQRQIPAIFIYTMGGIKAYHDVYDKSETLPLDEFSDLSNLLIDFVNSF